MCPVLPLADRAHTSYRQAELRGVLIEKSREAASRLTVFGLDGQKKEVDVFDILTAEKAKRGWALWHSGTCGR